MRPPSFKVGTFVPNSHLITYLLILCSLLCVKFVACVVISENVVYSSLKSPYSITDDIIIEKGGRLIVEPGTTLEFDAGVGVSVKGVLDARGSPSRPITFTSRNPPEGDLHPPTLRLIDGPSTTRGRLQIYYKDKWRSVCTNSKNWTRIDHHVTCRQLGFGGGSFYEWQDRANNDTSTFLYERPACQGHETDIGQCKGWYDHAIGGGVCDVHPDMGLACDEYHALWKGTNHWRGISFINSEYSEQLVQENLLFLKVSKSRLENIAIKYAGLGPKRETIGAVMVTGVPPVMAHMAVTRSLFTGINITMPDTFVSLRNSFISQNAGIGIFVNSSTGLVSIGENTIVSDNMADGIKYIQHHREPDVRNSEQFQDFCSGASNRGQTYPLVTVAEQTRNSYHDPNCMRKFFTSESGLVFTIHFTYIKVDQNDSATIEVRERDRNGELLTKFSLRNGTVAPSVVSYTNSIFVRFNAKPGRQVILYMQVLTQKYKIPDIVVNNSRIERNNGNGLSIDAMRSLVLVHKSNITDNIFGSGMSIRGGSGDVNVTYSTITNNIGDGINVTYEGGKQNITWSTVSNNEGRGFAVWFNHSARDTKIKQETGVAYSLFHKNLDVGIRVGNFCREAFVNISTNYFNDGLKDALEIESCWMPVSGVRTVHIGHNSFNRNSRLALLMSPAVHTNLTIEWNEFHANKRGTIKIYNEDILEIEQLPFIGKIYENTFLNNYGRYVMLLTLNIGSLDQSMFVSRNTVKKNVITEAYTTISSRSRASGVVCLGSFNIQLYRNLIENPLSLYELSSHALDQSSSINASYNWLGTKDEIELFERVFDRRDRYTLALIEFHPFLLSDNNMDTPVISPPQYNEPNFFNPSDKRIIGGEVNGNVVLTKSFYEVVRDIYVQHTGILTIPFGTTLEFAQGIGMMVTGTLRTEGSGDKMVRFTLSGMTEMEKIKALIEGGHIDELPENMTSANATVEDDGFEDENISYSADPVIPVKLIDGKDEMEGRLVVYSEGVWGTVCNHAWTIEAASVACQQMGYVLNPEDWMIESFDLKRVEGEVKILRSNVRCDEFDADFLGCEHDSSDDLVNSCSHNDDVGLICYPRTWAGVRLGMTAKESHMKGVIIEKAGLLDYSSRKFKPALQVDFNQHVLQELTLQDNSYDGLGIIRNNQYAISNPESRLLKKCIIRNNRRHGISFAQLGANITDSRIYDNSGSGLHFDPYLVRETQRELTGWLKLRQDDFVAIPDAILELGAENTANRMGQISSEVKINLVKDRHKGFITRNKKGEKEVEVVFTVTTSHTNVIGIQVLNPIERGSSENITIYDYHQVIENEDVAKWDLEQDMSVFPTTSSSYAITILYKSGKDAWGDTMFVLTAVERRDIAQENDLLLFRPKVPMVFLEDSKISRNNIGISTLHYNRFDIF